MKYHHLTAEERSQIYALKSKEYTQSAIAEFLGVHKSTISRELKRNTGERGYRPKQAQERADKRQQQAHHLAKRGKMTPEHVAYIEHKLRTQQWSPEQISGELQANSSYISHETLYRHIWADKDFGGDLYKHLRHKAKAYCRRSAKNAGGAVFLNVWV